ncbi:hypothetical protein Tco_1176367 [Tanacetum coccineum]
MEFKLLVRRSGGGRGVKEKQHGDIGRVLLLCKIRLLEFVTVDNIRSVLYINVVPTEPSYVQGSASEVIKEPDLIEKPKSLVSFAKLVTGESSRKSVNFHTLLAPAGNGDDVAILMECVRDISERFANIVYGFFLEKWLAYLVVANYVKNTWSKYGLVKSILNSSKELFFFKFSSKEGMDAMLENGPCYARAMIELRVDVELKDTIMVVIPKLVGEGSICLDLAKNLKNLRHAARGVPIGPKVGLKPVKPALRRVSNKNNAKTSGKKKKDVEPRKD